MYIAVSCVIAVWNFNTVCKSSMKNASVGAHSLSLLCVDCSLLTQLMHLPLSHKPYIN